MAGPANTRPKLHPMMDSLNLGTWPHGLRSMASCLMDLNGISQDVLKESKRLFTSDGQNRQPWEADGTEVEILCPGKPVMKINNLTAIQKALSETGKDCIRIILIGQQFSWAELDISQSIFNYLFSEIGVIPEFWPIVRAFGSKCSPIDQEFGGLYERKVSGIYSPHEVCYLVKHVKENGREWAVDAWSVRQTGLYHQTNYVAQYAAPYAAPYAATHCPYDKTETFIIINPSKTVRRLLTERYSAGSTTPLSDGNLIHIILATSVTSNWSRFIRCMEIKLQHLQEPSNLTPEHKLPRQYLEGGLKLTEEAYLLRDKLLRAAYMMKINEVVMAGIQSKFQINGPSQPANEYGTLISLMRETQLQRERIEMVLRRLEGVSTMIQNTLRFLELRTLYENGQKTAELLNKLQAQVSVVASQQDESDTEGQSTPTTEHEE